MMNNLHSCLLCMGSNKDRHAHMAYTRKALDRIFPDIRYGEEMETEAIGELFLSPFSNQVAIFHTPLNIDETKAILKGIEKENGRMPEDKAKGVVKMDIDLLAYDDLILKPDDMEKNYVQKGIEQLDRTKTC